MGRERSKGCVVVGIKEGIEMVYFNERVNHVVERWIVGGKVG